jgi:hypothetical protein
MNCLRLLERRNRGFESHSGHGCLVFVFYVRFSVFVYRERPCDELITRPRSPPAALDLVTKVKREVSWGRPRPESGCRAKEKKSPCS